MTQHERYDIVGHEQVSPDLKRFCERRVRPFLNTGGLSTRTIEHLMCEAYWQGIKDAAEVVNFRRKA